MPVYRDANYQIRDNQFWYSNCSFAQQIHDKKFITIRIKGVVERTFELMHSELGRDGRISTSFKFTNQSDLQWWKDHRHQAVQIELFAIEGEIIGSTGTESVRPYYEGSDDRRFKGELIGAIGSSGNDFEVSEEIISKWQDLQFPKVASCETFTWTGFDSAWSGYSPGAIAWMKGDQSGLFFEDVQMASFDDCLEHVDNVPSRMHLLMIDQPTIVQNNSGTRPVEKAVSHEVGRAGGGVQPSNREKDNMFGDNALIWTFLGKLKLKRFQETTAHYPKIKEGESI